MATKKCKAKFEPLNVKCDQESGHLVEEALPYEELESKHSYSGHVIRGGQRFYFHIEWD